MWQDPVRENAHCDAAILSSPWSYAVLDALQKEPSHSSRTARRCGRSCG